MKYDNIKSFFKTLQLYLLKLINLILFFFQMQLFAFMDLQKKNPNTSEYVVRDYANEGNIYYIGTLMKCIIVIFIVIYMMNIF